ncbi:MAG: LysM peptidoglycan-binding domain-containing M23 family metallopeptidase [Nitrospinota bacterium]
MRRFIYIAAFLAVIAGCETGKSIMRSPPSGKKIYIVKYGDTLEVVAKKFHTTPEALKKTNDLIWGKLTKGQRLVIPSPSEKAPAAAGSTPRTGKNAYARQAPVKKIKFIWPISGVVTSKFGARKNGKHDGLDIGADEGTRIVSAANGKVMFSGEGVTGYGLIVVIRHTDEIITVYAHNSKNLVKKGQSVKQGQPIALVGHTGRADGNHVHFEVRINRLPKNPLKFLPKRNR